MYRRTSLYRIAIYNVLFSSLLLVFSNIYVLLSIKLGLCILNAVFLAIVLQNLPRFLRNNHGRLFIGRKRTIIVLLCSVYIITTAISVYDKTIPTIDFFIFLVAWSVFMSVVYFFADELSFFLHKILKKQRRIAIVGFDDNTHKLAEKLKRKSNTLFLGHLDGKNLFESTTTTHFSRYIDYAKKNRINEFYISVDSEQERTVAILAEEAEKHCIRVNFIAPQNNELESGFYHLSYIGGLPVLQRYKEPLRSLDNQLLKRCFDLLVSSFVIIFVLSWLIPFMSILIKLESKGPVFFKQLRSGRDNNSFWCLKFRSMKVNKMSDQLQATKDDNRITKVGKFLRKTSLDEFPQFLNVFKGDMSIVGPRPHMLQHTEEYSGQVNHYMVRLYLKPGLTGWAQVKGYRGEVRNIDLMKERVEHDIWYMENWSLKLDVKIMYLTLVNIFKGEENAY